MAHSDTHSQSGPENRATRSAAATLVALTTALTLGACSAPITTACPAVGWFDNLEVQFEGDTSEVAEVQLCPERTCLSTLSEPLNEEILVPGDLIASNPTAGSWTFRIDMYHPEELTVRTLDSAGGTVTDTVVSPDWKRDDADVCGGPSSAIVTVTA
ncbi:hypothetical protein [Pseudoclavibacter sp. AY1F1]|uniref:hypothetical protein n=1 Tax=Pseudoclavibacter sp. AY1F1 TaxID=2080583 RepID=UPI0011B05573|nr:hypothetical protein [Pseudoclavibacter sp. AY1F1]